MIERIVKQANIYDNISHVEHVQRREPMSVIKDSKFKYCITLFNGVLEFGNNLLIPFCINIWSTLFNGAVKKVWKWKAVELNGNGDCCGLGR